ncbi:MAG: DUF3307 domain-containing protein [Anaerolineae bacterium]|nr:DUF3307 domain-containing protein [Anaerolineae bacterium]
MLSMMLLAHLLGDYLFQFNFIARWKARSLWGVLAHGGIVTLVTVICAILVDPGWWSYALLIGIVHTVIDVIKARLIHAKDVTWELIWFITDQVAHMIVILMVVIKSGASYQVIRFYGLPLRPDMRLLAFVLGYLLLLQPSWVLLRFLVRGIWGEDAAPPLGQGEKAAPMFERVLIASLAFAGQFALIPLVLLPRRMVYCSIQKNGLGVLVQLTTHWAETLLSVLLATLVGLLLRLIV